MLKSKHFFFSILVMTFAITTTQAQLDIAGMGFSYSALVRDTAGHVQPNTTVNLQFSILPSNSASSAIYVEQQTQITTDAYGFANTTIGTGNRVGGSASSFSAIDFTAGNYWILIQVYNNHTKLYDILGKQAMQLQAVPYAKVAYTSITGGIPTGTIVAFAGDTSSIPVGWHLCDGSTLSISDSRYANLFKVIGTYWGQLSPTTFQIPETRGFFLRGANLNATYDPDAGTRSFFTGATPPSSNVGSYQLDAVGPHTHNYKGTGHSIGIVNSNTYLADLLKPDDGSYSTTDNGNTDLETRPKNVYVNYIIKL